RSAAHPVLGPSAEGTQHEEGRRFRFRRRSPAPAGLPRYERDALRRGARRAGAHLAEFLAPAVGPGHGEGTGGSRDIAETPRSRRPPQPTGHVAAPPWNDGRGRGRQGTETLPGRAGAPPRRQGLARGCGVMTGIFLYPYVLILLVFPCALLVWTWARS